MEEATKSYNPFKMWGSYIGAIIGFFSVWPSIFILIVLGWCNGEFCENSGTFLGRVSQIIPAIIGFLLGWGIHSLIRKLRNK